MIANTLKSIQYKNKLVHTQQLLLSANKELHQQAHIDSLTNIANRRQFDYALQQEINRGARSEQPLSLILCDIDAFKSYNDELGHQQGDIALKQVAHTLSSQCQRQGDLATRYGGEEFAIILPTTSQAEAQQFVERLQYAMNQLAITHPSSKVSPIITLSYGIYSCIPNKQTSIEELVKKADNALYLAKENGRNRYEFFE